MRARCFMALRERRIWSSLSSFSRWPYEQPAAISSCSSLILLVFVSAPRLAAQCQPGGAAAPPQRATWTANPSEPQFYEEPQFTVAGVSDASNLGGHGSDVMVRTDESLAKETLTLSKAASAPAHASLAELEAAAQRNPADYAAGSAVAAAHADAGRYDDARSRIQSLLAQSTLSRQNQAALHHLLAAVE